MKIFPKGNKKHLVIIVNNVGGKKTLSLKANFISDNEHQQPNWII